MNGNLLSCFHTRLCTLAYAVSSYVRFDLYEVPVRHTAPANASNRGPGFWLTVQCAVRAESVADKGLVGQSRGRVPPGSFKGDTRHRPLFCCAGTVLAVTPVQRWRYPCPNIRVGPGRRSLASEVPLEVLLQAGHRNSPCECRTARGSLTLGHSQNRALISAGSASAPNRSRVGNRSTSVLPIKMRVASNRARRK